MILLAQVFTVLVRRWQPVHVQSFCRQLVDLLHCAQHRQLRNTDEASDTGLRLARLAACVTHLLHVAWTVLPADAQQNLLLAFLKNFDAQILASSLAADFGSPPAGMQQGVERLWQSGDLLGIRPLREPDVRRTIAGRLALLAEMLASARSALSSADFTAKTELMHLAGSVISAEEKVRVQLKQRLHDQLHSTLFLPQLPLFGRRSWQKERKKDGEER